MAVGCIFHVLMVCNVGPMCCSKISKKSQQKNHFSKVAPCMCKHRWINEWAHIGQVGRIMCWYLNFVCWVRAQIVKTSLGKWVTDFAIPASKKDLVNPLSNQPTREPTGNMGPTSWVALWCHSGCQRNENHIARFMFHWWVQWAVLFFFGKTMV